MFDEIMAIFSGVSSEDAMEDTKDLVEDVFTDAKASANLADSTNSTSSKLFIGPWLWTPELEIILSSTRQILAGH